MRSLCWSQIARENISHVLKQEFQIVRFKKIWTPDFAEQQFVQDSKRFLDYQKQQIVSCYPSAAFKKNHLLKKVQLQEKLLQIERFGMYSIIFNNPIRVTTALSTLLVVGS